MAKEKKIDDQAICYSAIFIPEPEDTEDREIYACGSRVGFIGRIVSTCIRMDPSLCRDEIKEQVETAVLKAEGRANKQVDKKSGSDRKTYYSWTYSRHRDENHRSYPDVITVRVDFKRDLSIAEKKSQERDKERKRQKEIKEKSKALKLLGLTEEDIKRVKDERGN